MSPNPSPDSEVRRRFTATIDDVDSERKWVVARINTDAVDSFDTVVDPAGMDRSDYERTKVVLWEHGLDPVRGRVPIGRNAWLKSEPGRGLILAKTVFADDDFSRGLFELYRDCVLKGWSVYGPSLQASPPTKEEIAKRPDLKRCKRIYRRWKLQEYSAVAIPGNLDAVTEACSRGVWLPSVIRTMVQDRAPAPIEPAPEPSPEPATAPVEPPPAALPPLVGRTREEVIASVERRAIGMARSELRQVMQDARDLARGKV